MNYIGILTALLPYFGYAVLGAVSNRLGLSRGKPEKILQFMLINLMVPILSLNFIIGNPVMENLKSIASAPFVGFFSVTIGFLIGFYASGLLGIQKKDSKRAFSFTLGMYNYMFFAVPLTLALYGTDVVGVLLVHNLGDDIAVWSVGAGLLAGGRFYNPVRLLSNPPILSILFALGINFYTGGAAMPPVLKSITHTISMIAIPCGLFVSGATLAGNMGLFAKSAGVKIMGGSILLRLFVIPFLFVYAVSLFPLPDEVKMVTAIQAAMPSGMSTAVIVKYFNSDAETSVPVILATTLVSIFTMPLWITIFQRILGV